MRLQQMFHRWYFGETNNRFVQVFETCKNCLFLTTKKSKYSINFPFFFFIFTINAQIRINFLIWAIENFPKINFFDLQRNIFDKVR